MRTLSVHSSVWILTVALALAPKPAASQGFGAVQIALHSPSGEPAAGLIVGLEDTGEEVVSDTNGMARFDAVPAGEHTWSVAREVAVPNQLGLPETQRFTVDSAIQTKVLAGEAVAVAATVEINVIIIIGKICWSTPWCGIVGGTMPAGNRRVVTGGGVHGSCPCVFTGGPVIPPACPGRITVDPAAAGAWTITSTTCLGGFACALPKKAATCSINV